MYGHSRFLEKVDDKMLQKLAVLNFTFGKITENINDGETKNLRKLI